MTIHASPMPDPIRIIGSYISPYVRKVLVCLDLKGVPYRIDPVVPFYGNDEFARLSPLRRVPVLVDGDVVLADSTVICEYLNERYPQVPLLPEAPAQRAQSRWLEEFADTRMGDAFIWNLFNQFVIRRAVWGEKPDDALVKKTLEVDIPSVMNYLEPIVPQDGFLFGNVGIADVAIATFFRNAEFARWRIDASRWPTLAAYVQRVRALNAFSKLQPFEEICLRTPVIEHRTALAELGAPLTTETVFTETPRRGVMLE